MCANSKPPNKTLFHKFLYVGPTFVRAFHFEDRGMVMRVAPSTFKTHKISYSWDWLLTTNNVRGPVMGRGQQGESPGAAVITATLHQQINSLLAQFHDSCVPRAETHVGSTHWAWTISPDGAGVNSPREGTQWGRKNSECWRKWWGFMVEVLQYHDIIWVQTGNMKTEELLAL